MIVTWSHYSKCSSRNPGGSPDKVTRDGSTARHSQELCPRGMDLGLSNTGSIRGHHEATNSGLGSSLDSPCPLAREGARGWEILTSTPSQSALTRELYQGETIQPRAWWTQAWDYYGNETDRAGTKCSKAGSVLFSQWEKEHRRPAQKGRRGVGSPQQMPWPTKVAEQDAGDDRDQIRGGREEKRLAGVSSHL